MYHIKPPKQIFSISWLLLDLASIEYLCVITLVIHRNILVVTVVVSQLKSQPRGNDIMNKISDKIKSGSRAFLVTEYKYLSVFVISMFLLLFILYAVDPLSTGQWTDGVRYGLSFLTGATLSAVAGWAGMVTATDANVRTTQAAATNGLPAALRVAFTGGML